MLSRLPLATSRVSGGVEVWIYNIKIPAWRNPLRFTRYTEEITQLNTFIYWLVSCLKYFQLNILKMIFVSFYIPLNCLKFDN